LFANIVHYLPFVLTVAFAFLFYRPFCYLVCPIGLLTNLVEQVGLFRVVLKKPPCNDCGVCTTNSPCPTVPEILKGSAYRPDCFSCTSCINSCPSKSLEFGVDCGRKRKADA
jgi:polyferredoxin